MSSRQLDTGTGTHRRRLTLAEAQRGDRPAPFTADEWAALHAATAQFPGPARYWQAHDLAVDSSTRDVPAIAQ
jgi:hypothetical protein